MYAVCDVGDYDSITAAVAKVMDAYGRIDILVNAAGMGNNKWLPIKAMKNGKDTFTLT